MSDTILYSQIPSDEIDAWGDDDLSGAIWDEAIELVGGYTYELADVLTLPFGYSAILLEGAVRGHIEGDGVVTAIWNDDGAHYMSAASDVHRRAGSVELADLLDEICQKQREWCSTSGKKPRDLEYDEWKQTEHCQELDNLQLSTEMMLEPAFSVLMQHLRQHPELFRHPD